MSRLGRAASGFDASTGEAPAGRLSTSDPNLQSIPVRTDLGREIRSAFIAEDGHRLLSADYSQIELRILAHVSGEPKLREAFARVVETFGGVDIVVSNAGAAWQGRIGEVDEELLRKSFELNFYGHQRVAQAAGKIMLAQGTGGCLLFNVSKQAVNPGPNFGPYGLPKAATLFLVRQYAVDYGAAGIRANAVNADRVRSGLLTDAFIADRAKARGFIDITMTPAVAMAIAAAIMGVACGPALALTYDSGAGNGELGLDAASPPQLRIADVVEHMRPALTDRSILKLGHNAKFDLQVLACLGIDAAPVDDSTSRNGRQFVASSSPVGVSRSPGAV